MGKSIALFFACAALVVLAGSFWAPNPVAAALGCAPAFGLYPGPLSICRAGACGAATLIR